MKNTDNTKKMNTLLERVLNLGPLPAPYGPLFARDTIISLRGL